MYDYRNTALPKLEFKQHQQIDKWKMYEPFINEFLNGTMVYNTNTIRISSLSGMERSEKYNKKICFISIEKKIQINQSTGMCYVIAGLCHCS